MAWQIERRCGMGLLLKWAIFAIYTVVIGYLAFIFGCVYEAKKAKERENAEINISKRNL